MKFFAFITLLSLLMLTLSKPFAPAKPRAKRSLPESLTKNYRSFKDSFTYPQNANVAWALMTGEKKGITPNVLKNIEAMELGFLFSPSGLQLGGLLCLLTYLFKKFSTKKIKKRVEIIFLITAYILPFLAIKRLILFRFLIIIQKKIKLDVSVDIIFCCVFILSFLLGHYEQSPLGFILSFLYMGTFISLRDQAKPILILGLFSSHLLVAFFSGQETSFISLLLNIPFITYMSFVFPFLYLYLFTYQLIPFNWIEWFMRIFIVALKLAAKVVQGSLVSSSFFLILAIWMILLKKQKGYLVVLLILHCNTVQSPAIFHS